MNLRARALLLGLCTSAVFADIYPRQPSIDVQHYVFRVELSDTSDEIAGETTVSVRFLKDGLTSFWLDLATSAEGKGMTVSAVTAQAAPAQFTHRDDRLTIALAPSCIV